MLKPNGVLLNFDSDYGRETFSKKENQEHVHANIQQELIDTCNSIKDSVRISIIVAPAGIQHICKVFIWKSLWKPI